MTASTLYSSSIFLLFLLSALSSVCNVDSAKDHKPKPDKGPPDSYYCNDPGVKCEGIRVTCPEQCLSRSSLKVVRRPCRKLAMSTVKIRTVKRFVVTKNIVHADRKPNCNGIGSACYDPRFVGGDGIMFYFHGKTDENFSLVSDKNLQINACFIGRRPLGRSRDNTWIQALGLMFGSHTLTLSANKVAQWDDEVDQLALTYNNISLLIPKGHLSTWSARDSRLTVERTTWANTVTIILPGVLEMSINVVPVTKEDDRIHNYQIPSDDCFAHIEVQFKFLYLSEEVEGVLGQTYRPDFKNPVKRGVPMPVMGGEDRFQTSSLLSSNCRQCIFAGDSSEAKALTLDSAMVVDCSCKTSTGRGFVCRR